MTNKDKHITKVKFLLEKDVDGIKGDVMAFFPNDNWNNLSNTTKVCYAHIGQHSACHTDYANECKVATKKQYQDLLNELTGLGYNLQIINK